ncbi:MULTISPECIES: LOG family protein [unclassified Chryseobacterium]|uniref:LOG family protein n=1 Tax=unclassified Chryseobacterium TaxID=2593645 RepID=UPI000D385AFD|nr:MULTISPECIES: LOG family protein [unclassified Chryseobacterium]PTT72597.1 hypothetical protein DBR25_14340 [Chryseobacterium sp. HMWF001]PVV50418.1 hypothetical protein DD829_22400 [Chryseobacterium sp. HMWF035]
MIHSFSFFGSSSDLLAAEHEELVGKVLDQIFSRFKTVRIITGGYAGFMELISRIAKEKKERKYPDLFLVVYGILYEPYKEIPNSFLDKTIVCENLGERVQTLIELSDHIIAFPGSSGTLHEILQAAETIKYSSLSHLKLWVHNSWKQKLDDFQLSIEYFNEDSVFDFNQNDFRSYHENTVKDFVINENNILEIINMVIDPDKYNILALDTAFNFYGKDLNTGMNESLSVNEYPLYLEEFLESHPSLLHCNEDFSAFHFLNNKNLRKTLYLEKSKISEIKKPRADNFRPIKADEAFKIWNEFLLSKQFGKVSFWINKPFSVKGIEVNVSCFLVLDIEIPDAKCKRIISILNNYLFLFIAKDISSKLSEALEEKYFLHKFKQNVEAQRHTIFNILGPSETFLKTAHIRARHLNDLQLENNIANAMGTFKIFDICFRSMFDERSDNHFLYGKTIDNHLRYLEECYLSTGTEMEFDIRIDSARLPPIHQEMPVVFMIVWNLFHNAYTKKEENSLLKVKMYQELNNCYIEFSNEVRSDLLDKAYIACEYLKGKREVPIKEKGGLSIIVQSLETVKDILTVDSDKTFVNDKTFTTTLKVNNHGKEN